MAKKRAEDQFEGFKKRLYCWMRRQRISCAVHKTLYYDLATPILEDKQYDYIEAKLEAVENRHPDIAASVKNEGYFSPRDYVDSLRLDDLMATAKATHIEWKNNGSPHFEIPEITAEHNALILYSLALPEIVGYPI